MEIFSFTFGLFQLVPQLTCKTRQLLQLGLAQTTPRREEVCIGQRFGFVAEAFALGGGLACFFILLNPSALDEFLFISRQGHFQDCPILPMKGRIHGRWNSQVIVLG